MKQELYSALDFICEIKQRADGTMVNLFIIGFLSGIVFHMAILQWKKKYKEEIIKEYEENEYEFKKKLDEAIHKHI